VFYWGNGGANLKSIPALHHRGQVTEANTVPGQKFLCGKCLKKVLGHVQKKEAGEKLETPAEQKKKKALRLTCVQIPPGGELGEKTPDSGSRKSKKDCRPRMSQEGSVVFAEQRDKNGAKKPPELPPIAAPRKGGVSARTMSNNQILGGSCKVVSLE